MRAWYLPAGSWGTSTSRAVLCRRRTRAVHPNVRGIAVSGYVGEQYEQQCREAGYERMLPKPLVFESILTAIGRVPLTPAR